MLSVRVAVVLSAVIALRACGVPEMAIPLDDRDEAVLIQRARVGRHRLESEGCTVQPDTDYEGGDYKNVNADSAEDCCAACSADSQCQVGVLYQGVCYMKKNVDADSSRSSKGRVAVVAPAPACTVQQDTDYEGGDYRRVATWHVQACCIECSADPQCKVAVNYEGYCYLKSNIGVGKTSTGRVAVLAGGSPSPTPSPAPVHTPAPTPSPPAPACTVQQDTDYDGGDYKNVPADSTEACCEACSADYQCKAGVLYLGVCYMKNTIGAGRHNEGRIAVLAGGSTPAPTPSTTPVPTPAPTPAVSPAPSPAPNLCTDNQGVDCFGDDLDGGHFSGITSHDDCCALCGQHPGCSAWTWRRTTEGCYLKGACSNRRSDSDCHSSPTPPPSPPGPSPTPSPTPSHPPSGGEGYHQGPIVISRDGERLNLNVAALDRGLVVSSKDGTSISMTYGEQTRAFVVNKSIDDMPVDNYVSFNLLGKELSYDIDISKVGCSCNAALFFTSMPGYNPDGSIAHGAENPFYCDANNVGGVWCWEHDSIESNRYTMATTPHSCSQAPGGYIQSCDGIGCSTNAHSADPNGMCPESRCKINTMHPFRLRQKHVVDGANQLTKITNTLVQGSSTFEWDVCSTNLGYLKQMTESLTSMKMVFQLWGTSYGRMNWLDGMTGCSGDCNTATATVTFSNIEINSL